MNIKKYQKGKPVTWFGGPDVVLNEQMPTFNLQSSEPQMLTVPIYSYWYGNQLLQVPQEEVEKAYGYHRNVMTPDVMPSPEELQKMLDKEVIFSQTDGDWKDRLKDDDYKTMFEIIPRSTIIFNDKVRALYDYHDYTKYRNDSDETSDISITAPNTDISKFIYGNVISNNALQEIARVSALRGQDPYDVLAHMLIESSGERIDMSTYFNTHDVISRQINPNLLDYYSEEINILKQLGIYDEKRIPTVSKLKAAFERFQNKRDAALKKVIVPESNIDAVALRMMLHGRDFNPAQKGSYSMWTDGYVKNSYLDMIDSAIQSLKTNMPNLFN